MARNYPGILIAVEGIDGSGKTTQVGLLADFLTQCGEQVVRSKEPTDGKWGQKIRSSATTGRMSLGDELDAFIEDRKEHVATLIKPALEAGKIVILDRYYYSTIAYQGSRGADVNEISIAMAEIAPEPDVVFLLDVPSEVGIARISHGRNETPNEFETSENLKAVRKVFLKIETEHANMVKISGANSKEAVAKQILNELLNGVLKRHRCAKEWDCDGLHCTWRIVGQCRWAKMVGEASLLAG